MPTKQRNEAEFQSYQVRSKSLSATLFISLVVCYGFFFFLIARANLGGIGWVELLPTLSIVAVPLLFHPMTTFWVYKPWQAKRRKNERTYLD